MLVAAKVLALTAVDLFLAAGFEYAPLLGDREPPLGYRK